MQKVAQSGKSTPTRLTPREVEVLKLVVEGHSSQAMADQLGCAKRTVDFHLANIYRKLDVSSRIQALNAARKKGELTD